ncbi:SYF2 splicing factor-domain-containing protein [Mycotypha africana]|uniref:SYF2 splicing factor-domain-containing protein n=1 Tax=Mycotypha africana TaxID=64632 RepID=UPI00230062CF|nr:SYF2 splicing factor-domain-containing protein [Mycotypha africana]KAI8988296.1 SYF2 splicing factor-domain-containing protein [Mycotypha africana]
MPPKRKATGRKATQKSYKSGKTIEKDVVKEANVDDSIESTAAEETQSAKRKRESTDENVTDNDASAASTKTDENKESAPAVGSNFSDRLARLKELKRRRATEVEQGNRRDRNLEFQRSKENPKAAIRDERKRAEALKLLEKQEAEDKGEDYERKQFWKYSAESAEAWEKKMAKKQRLANTGFSGEQSSLNQKNKNTWFCCSYRVYAFLDHTQAAHKKYVRLMSDFKPDMRTYNQKILGSIERAIRNGEDPSDVTVVANSIDYASIDDKPSQDAIDRLALETKKQIEKRETRSRDRKEKTDDISWINEKNRVFNQKIARFYDKYTKEIRENLERAFNKETQLSANPLCMLS